MPKRKAYTVIEMVVVIGIIVALLTLLIPAVSSMRVRSKRIQCASNMRQFTQACLTYAAQTRGFLPVLNSSGNLPNQMTMLPFENWRKSFAPAGSITNLSNPDFYPLTKAMCFCPANSGLGELSGWWDTRKIGYFYLGGVDSYSTSGNDQFYDPTDPATALALPPGKSGYLHIKLDDPAYYDVMWMDINCWTSASKTWTGNHTSIRGNPPNILPTDRNGGTNVSYNDGHVEWVPQWKIQKRATINVAGGSTDLYW